MSDRSIHVVKLNQIADAVGLNEVEAAEYVLDHHSGYEQEFVKFCESYLNGGEYNGF